MGKLVDLGNLKIKGIMLLTVNGPLLTAESLLGRVEDVILIRF